MAALGARPVSAAPRQLVLLGGTPTALAVARDAYRLGLECRVVDVDGGVLERSSAVHQYVRCAGYDEALRWLGSVRGAYWIIADSDHWLRFLTSNRSALPNATVLHPSNSVIEICLAKDRFTRWCQEAGFDTPAIVDPSAAVIRFPVVVRPNATRHREGDAPKAWVARNRAELDAGIASYERANADFVVTEALIDAATRYFAVGFARRADGALAAFATEKVRPPVDRCRGASYVETCEFPEAIDVARRVAERLEFVGMGELEIAYRDGKLNLVELNPRPWLQYGMGPALGVSTLAFLALGEAPSEARRKVTWISVASDAFWCLSRTDGLVWNAGLPLRRFIAQVLGADCRPLWDWRDPLPFVRSLLSRRQ
jgi:predicted ATP-grasp superfamily ATP-dependent carboligase